MRIVQNCIVGTEEKQFTVMRRGGKENGKESRSSKMGIKPTTS